MRVDANKVELFALLAEQIQGISIKGKKVVSTFGENVISSSIRTTSQGLASCTHEEVDTSIFIDVADATDQKFKQILIRPSDRHDVVFAQLNNLHTKVNKAEWIRMLYNAKACTAQSRI